MVLVLDILSLMPEVQVVEVHEVMEKLLALMVFKEQMELDQVEGLMIIM